MFNEECAICKKTLNDTTPCKGMAHTDVFFCEECFSDESVHPAENISVFSLEKFKKDDEEMGKYYASRIQITENPNLG